MPKKCILLKDAVACRQVSNKWNPLLPKYVAEHLLRGTLLVELTEDEAQKNHQRFTAQLNYKKHSDDSVKLYCKPEQIQQLSDKQFDLLLAVKLPVGRYKALNILNWVEKLKVGCSINVIISTTPQPVGGIIQYIGSLPSEDGTKFGIELMENRGKGVSDGTFNDTEYFKCDCNCAVFVAMDKLSEPETSKSSQVHETVQPDPSLPNAALKLGDRVTFNDQNHKPVNGIVRWIGRNNILRSGSKIVGIETDQLTSSTLIPGSIVRMNHMFTLHNAKSVKVFLPIDSVFKEDPAIISKDKYVVSNSDPEATMQLIHHHSKKASQSRRQFVSEQLEHHEKIEFNRQQEEATKRQEKQGNIAGIDFDLSKANIDEQKRHDEETQHASKQQGQGQNQIKSILDGDINVSQQHGVRQHQSSGNHPGSKVDSTTDQGCRIEQQFYDSQTAQYQNKQPVCRQGSDIEYTDACQQQIHGSQARHLAQDQSQQSGHQGQNVDHFVNECNFGKQQQVPEHQYKPLGHQVPNVDHTDYKHDVVQQEFHRNGSQFSQNQSQRHNFSSGVFSLSQDSPDAITEKAETGDDLCSATSSGAAVPLPKKLDGISVSCNSDEATANLEHQVKQLQIDRNHHNEQLTNFSTAVNKLEKMLAEIQTSNDHLKNQISLTQQQLVDVQKANEVLQVSNTHLQNQLSITQHQLSLTQKQILGVQSMITGSRLWIVSHDQFRIEREIGRGAWASVHETTFRGATVAAKCLNEIINAPKTIHLFQREMEMAIQCQHHNIVAFLGATLEEPLVILMELMDTSLRSANEQGNVKDHQMLGIFHDIASALHFLHTRPDPVIHREVSSTNVLLKVLYNGEWLAKLGDLGTAKIQQHIATPGPGALTYAAPEAADPKCHSTKMDVYSFGVLVIEILTKTLPFENLSILKAQVQQQFPQYHQFLISCTNQESSDRPTMYEVIVQLDKVNTTRP